LFVIKYELTNSPKETYAMNIDLKGLHGVEGSITDGDVIMLHEKYDHMSLRKLKSLAMVGELDHVEKSVRVKLANTTVIECFSCKRGGKVSGKFPAKSASVITAPMELISSDHCGPFPLMYGGNKYYSLFIHHKTKFVFFFEQEDVQSATLVRHMESQGNRGKTLGPPMEDP
jgi:hypothetical protein